MGISSGVRPGPGVVKIERMFYTGEPPVSRLPDRSDPWHQTPYAELHCHTNFSFLDGASAPDDLVERAVELGLTGLAVTDHDGLYGAVRFVSAAEAAGSIRSSGSRSSCSIRPSPTRTGSSSRRADRAAAARPRAIRRPAGPGRTPPLDPTEGLPARPRPDRARLPGHRAPVKEDLRGIGERAARPAPRPAGPDRRSAGGACAGSSRAPTWPGPRACRGSARRSSPSTPRASSRCRAAATARSPAGCGRAIGPGRARSPSATRRCSGAATGRPRAASSSSCRTTSCPTTTGSSPRRRRWPSELGLPVVVTNDVHYARPEDRELHDVLTAIRHGRTLDDARRPAPARRRVVPQVGRRSWPALPPRPTASAAARGLGGGDRRPRSSSRRRARSISASSSTASRASRCPTGRRRSRTCRSCAGRAPGSATTR